MTRLLLALILVASSASVLAQAREVERQPSAEAQMRYALEMRRQARREPAVRAPNWRAKVAEAYEAVPIFHPRAHHVGVEARFRAGELRRAAGELEAATELFREAADARVDSRFRTRARLELGHTLRRRERYEDALLAYERVVHDARSQRRYKDLALFWKARVFLEIEKIEDGSRVLQCLIDGTQDPLMQVRAYDELGLVALDEGDLEWAAGLLEQCRKAISGPLLEETSLGHRTRSAFRRMRCRSRLQEEVARRTKQQQNSFEEQRDVETRRVRRFLLE